jgi:NADPH:quinone reductase-like Zn-dependent oxidoreductase
MANRYKKLVATTFSTDFREAAEIVEEEIPEPGPQEVLVRNKYAAVNATDVNISAGRYEAGAKPPLDLGVEAAGVVVDTGAEVKHLEDGDSVVTSTLGGGYREYNLVHASNAIQVPQPSPEALSIMVSGLTASIALEEVGSLAHDETVLVTAAAGGTGQYAVQLAKQAGNHVIGTCGTQEKAARTDRRKSVGSAYTPP